MSMVKRAAMLSIVVLTLCAFVVDSPILAKKSNATTKERAVKSKKKTDTEMVKSVQRALVDAGFKIKVDGKIGRQVRAALKKYQKQNKLKVTGRIDKATLKKMGIASSPRT